MIVKPELSPWNLAVNLAGPPSPGFVWLIPGLGERGVFTQPVLTAWIGQLPLLEAPFPEPRPPSSRGSPLGQVWLANVCPQVLSGILTGGSCPPPPALALGCEAGAALSVLLIFPFPDGDPAGFPGLLRGR